MNDTLTGGNTRTANTIATHHHLTVPFLSGLILNLLLHVVSGLSCSQARHGACLCRTNYLCRAVPTKDTPHSPDSTILP